MEKFEEVLMGYPDVEAMVVNCRKSKRSIYSGYKPAHLVRKDYYTTGVHYYIDQERIEYGHTGKAYIKFITPEAYPNCLREGDKIPFCEGEVITGYATIVKVFNRTLLCKN